ncbi:hypothetical protein GMAR_ORF281 [Golden Marseillevirus]|uniref:hypothetical protein n=1 Tax=Golden Marseillevirus TaxID=1720526 RepID=UPI000877ACF4|nr:hypothetical protein GMAR_ORF281 [Golden Marseillevirus]ALX27655.1 hypothetical protein GMAR_ORF281 [Golden Marseillevirus]
MSINDLMPELIVKIFMRTNRTTAPVFPFVCKRWKDAYFIDYAKRLRFLLCNITRKDHYLVKSNEPNCLYKGVYEPYPAKATLNIAKWANSQGCQLRSRMFVKAAKRADFEMLEWLDSKGLKPSYHAHRTAIRHGKLDVLKWLRKPCHQPQKMDALDKYYRGNGLCFLAIDQDQMEILQWFFRKDKSIPFKFLEHAEKYGSARCFKWLYARVGEIKFKDLNPFRRGDIEILSFLRPQWEKHVGNPYIIAIFYGHLHVLEWLFENGFETGQEPHACYHAVYYGKLEVLKWLRKHNFPWGETKNMLAKHPDSELVKWGNRKWGTRLNELFFFFFRKKKNMSMDDLMPELLAEIFLHTSAETTPVLKYVCKKWKSAYSLDHTGTLANRLSQCRDTLFLERAPLNVFKWADSQGCPFSSHAFRNAAARADLEMLEWLKRKGVKPDFASYRKAARRGHVNVLEWIHKHSNGIEVNRKRFYYSHSDEWRTCLAAVKKDQLEVLEWLSNNGYQTSGYFLQDAAKYASLRCFKFLYSNEPKDQENVIEAAFAAFKGGNVEILSIILSEWKKQGTVGSPYALAAVCGGHPHVLDWLLASGYETKESRACYYAVKAKKLEALKWLRKHDFSWEEAKGVLGEMDQNEEIVKWAVANGVLE